MKTLNFLNSANIRTMQWDAGRLIIKFVGGKQYEYENVPEFVFDEAGKAVSAGKYFSEHIRGKFKTKQMDK